MSVVSICCSQSIILALLSPEDTLVKTVPAGMASGAIASAVANPTDVLKVLCLLLFIILF